MPKATLLSAGTTFAFRFGSKLFEFKGGIAEEIPTAVALGLKPMIGRGGKPLFRIEGLPTIIEAVPDPRPIRPNVEFPRQLQFAI